MQNKQNQQDDFGNFDAELESEKIAEKLLIFVFFYCNIYTQSSERHLTRPPEFRQLLYIMFSSYFLLLKALGFSPGVFNLYGGFF